MSSHDFIRALKASSDPPVPNGLSKLEIASSGWKDNSLLVPRKDQVITDWIISKFHKDSARFVALPIYINKDFNS